MRRSAFQNREHNRQQPSPVCLPSGMIDEQQETGRYFFGQVWQKPHHARFSIQHLTRIPEGGPGQIGSNFNGCGWIAAYNVLRLLNRPLPPWKIIDGLESGAVLRGYLGLSPFSLRRFFQKQGFQAKLHLLPWFFLPSQNIRTIKKYFADQPCAIFYVVTKNKTVHYVSTQSLGNGTYYFYNDNHESGRIPDTLENFVRRQASVILMLTIRNH